MKDIFIKWLTGFNAYLIRISKGRIGSRLGTQTILLLHTIGRKSGTPRTAPVAYFQHEENYLLVGSNWGRDRHADWYLNLLKQPRAIIQVDGMDISVNADEARGDEHARLWKFVTERHPPYLDYQNGTARLIPVVVLRPRRSQQ